MTSHRSFNLRKRLRRLLQLSEALLLFRRNFFDNFAGRKKQSSQGGYTLIELVVAMMIFAVVLVTAIGSYVSVTQSSTKAGAQRNVQQDARFNVEEIARTVRSAAVDYAFYSLN